MKAAAPAPKAMKAMKKDKALFVFVELFAREMGFLEVRLNFKHRLYFKKTNFSSEALYETKWIPETTYRYLSLYVIKTYNI